MTILGEKKPHTHTERCHYKFIVFNFKWTLFAAYQPFVGSFLGNRTSPLRLDLGLISQDEIETIFS